MKWERAVLSTFIVADGLKTGASAFSPSAINLLLIFIVKESHCTPFPFLKCIVCISFNAFQLKVTEINHT